MPSRVALVLWRFSHLSADWTSFWSEALVADGFAVFLRGLLAGLGATFDVKALADLVAPFFAVVFMSMRPCLGSVAGKYTGERESRQGRVEFCCQATGLAANRNKVGRFREVRRRLRRAAV